MVKNVNKYTYIQSIGIDGNTYIYATGIDSNTYF